MSRLDKSELIADLVDNAVDGVDLKTLIRDYADTTEDWLKSLDEKELIEYAETAIYNFKLEEYQDDSNA